MSTSSSRSSSRAERLIRVPRNLGDLIEAINASMGGVVPKREYQRYEQRDKCASVRESRASEAEPLQHTALREEIRSMLEPPPLTALGTARPPLICSVGGGSKTATSLIVSAVKQAAAEDDWLEVWVLLGQVKLSIQQQASSDLLPWWRIQAEADGTVDGDNDIAETIEILDDSDDDTCVYIDDSDSDEEFDGESSQEKATANQELDVEGGTGVVHGKEISDMKGDEEEEVSADSDGEELGGKDGDAELTTNEGLAHRTFRRGRKPNDVRWEEKFRELALFKRQTGHCRVPANTSSLGAWVDYQRQAYRAFQVGKRQRAMSEERIAKLNELGFEWSAKPRLEAIWEAQYQKLVDYKNREGHCMVPSRDAEGLGKWVITQRSSYKRFSANSPRNLCGRAMTHERIEKLESIGFVWSIR